VTLRDFNVTPVRGERPVGLPGRPGGGGYYTGGDCGTRDAGRTWNRGNPRRSYERDERGSANPARCTDPDEYIALPFAARSDDPSPPPPPPLRAISDSSAIVVAS